MIRANDDAVALQETSLQVEEGQDAVIVIERTGSALGPITVQWVPPSVVYYMLHMRRDVFCRSSTRELFSL